LPVNLEEYGMKDGWPEQFRNPWNVQAGIRASVGKTERGS